MTPGDEIKLLTLVMDRVGWRSPPTHDEFLCSDCGTDLTDNEIETVVGGLCDSCDRWNE